MTRILQFVRGTAAWVRGPGGLPSLVLAGMAAVSVALACLGAEDAQEHWKKQLDGFLEAGIIDRSEYRVLQERRRR